MSIKEDIKAIEDAFAAFEEAIEDAQRQYHNCDEWTSEQHGPINAARDRFYRATAKASGGSGK